MTKAETMAEIYDREEMAAIVAAGGNVELAAVALPVADGDAQDGGGVSSSTATAPAAPAQIETAAAKMARANNQQPPAHYLKGPPEPWRPYIHWFL